MGNSSRARTLNGLIKLFALDISVPTFAAQL